MTTVLYIAGPMTGHVDRNYPTFMKVEKKLTECDHDYVVINPARLDEEHERERKMLSLPNTCAECDRGEQHDWRWYMRRTLRMLLEADGVALLPGWHNSAGALLEQHVAERLQMRTMLWYDWVSPLPLNVPRNPTRFRHGDDIPPYKPYNWGGKLP